MTRRLPPSRRRLSRSRPPARRSDHAGEVALRGWPPDRAEGAETTPSPSFLQRDGDRALRCLAQENAMLARELGRVQQRCTTWRTDAGVQADRLEALLMRARAAAIVKDTQLAALRETLDALQRRTAVGQKHEELVRHVSDLRARHRWLEQELHEARRALVAARAAPDCTAGLAPMAPLPTARRDPRPIERAALGRVLCVGGRARQVPVYRELIERRGGHVVHVDGSTPECLAALVRHLAEADVVILQAGYACDSACRVVETHCGRTGLRFVQLVKACGLGFERCLDDLAPTGNPNPR